jgi:hypothetical protein
MSDQQTFCACYNEARNGMRQLAKKKFTKIYKVWTTNDEDIPPNDTPMPTTQQGPMKRARARELNYQVNSFRAIHKPSSMNGALRNSCDAFLILRNLGHEPDWRESKHDKKASVDDQMDHTSSDLQEGATSKGHNS